MNGFLNEAREKMWRFLLLLSLLLVEPAKAQTTAEVLRVQTALNQWGYEISELDGLLSDETVAAIRQYQSDWGLSPTGAMSTDLVKRLERRHPATKPRMQKATNTDCEIRNLTPQARAQLTYTGPCAKSDETVRANATWRFMHGGEWKEMNYEGEFRSGLANGQGEARWVDGSHHGSWLNGKEHGYGETTWINGDVYKGNYAAGEIEGNGTKIWANGDRYKGEWRNGLRNGKGTYSWASGNRYQGDYVDGKKEGFGMKAWVRGDRYEGEWQAGRQNGKGTYTWANGKQYVGEFRDDEFDGYGVLTWPTGSTYEGEWQHDKPHGYGVYRSSDGTEIAGTWKQGCWTDGQHYHRIATTPAACGFPK